MKDCRISALSIKRWSDTLSALKQRDLAVIGPEVNSGRCFQYEPG